MAGQSDWRAILSAFFVGVAGAIQVGRVAPVATFLQHDLNLGLFNLGWLVSLITLASALFGLLAGYLVVLNGLRASVVFGALLMGCCALVAAFATSIPTLIGSRIIEGVGYLVVVVSAPTLIARDASAKNAPFALAMWGTFFTLGLSIAAFAGGFMSGVAGWRGWFFTSSILVFVAAAFAFRAIPKDVKSTEPAPNVWTTFPEMPKSSWLLGAAFLGLTLLALSILSLLPTFLVQEHGFTPSAAGGATGSVALASIAGSLSYGLLAKRSSDAVIVSGTSIALIAAAFPAFSNGATPSQIITFASLSIFMSGILVAQTFAAVPKLAGSPRLIGPSNGLVAQLGSIGALTGPPMVGALISVADWEAVPMVVAGFTLSFAILFILALRYHQAPLLEKDT